MTRQQFGRLMQMERDGWVDVGTSGPGASTGGPFEMRRGAERIIVGNDGSVTLTSTSAPRSLAGSFVIGTDDQPDAPVPPV